MSTSAAQILGWLLAASAGTRIVDDLIEHGHGLAAVCQPALVNRDTAAAIVTQVEQGTGDDGMLVAGAALSGAVMPWMLDQATQLNSRLRSGYMYSGWGLGGANAAEIIPRSRALADPRAVAAVGRLGAVWGLNGSELSIDSDELGFVYGYEDYLPRSKWAQCACDLAARDALDPEVALMIALRGVAMPVAHASAVKPEFATVLATAFERRRLASVQPAVQPPAIAII
jgi:hypothetical protein